MQPYSRLNDGHKSRTFVLNSLLQVEFFILCILNFLYILATVVNS